MESSQEVPEFLEPYRPIGEITFDEPDSDAEEDEGQGGDFGGGAGDATGGGGGGEWGNEGAGTTEADNSGW